MFDDHIAAVNNIATSMNYSSCPAKTLSALTPKPNDCMHGKVAMAESLISADFHD